MNKSWKNLLERFLFLDKGVVPTWRLIFAFILLSVFLILVGNHLTWATIIVMNVLFLLLSILDLWLSPRKKDVTITRTIPTEMERGIDYSVTIHVENPSTYDMVIEVKDGIPQSFHRPFPIKAVVPKESEKVFTYQTKAPIRGHYFIEKLFVRYSSKLGLWQKQMACQLKEQIKVIPDMTQSKNYLANAQKYLLHEGVQIKKQIQGVGEFAKIRSYVVGDDPRKINWRQTAKLREVMTNEYEPEHGKYVTILIDCGRMMGAELKNGNRLEKSLEAALTVATAALHKGDYVAVLAFSKKVKVFIPPAKGMAHLQTILQAIYSLEVDASESNYAEAFQYLQLVQKKRSLLLLFSDVTSFLHEENALIYLKRIRQRHLFLLIGVEDEALLKIAREDSSDVEKAMGKSVAQQQLVFKKRQKHRWEKQGLLMVEAREEQLATAAVSYYIDTINKGLL